MKFHGLKLHRRKVFLMLMQDTPYNMKKFHKIQRLFLFDTTFIRFMQCGRNMSTLYMKKHNEKECFTKEGIVGSIYEWLQIFHAFE